MQFDPKLQRVGYPAVWPNNPPQGLYHGFYSDRVTQFLTTSATPVFRASFAVFRPVVDG